VSRWPAPTRADHDKFCRVEGWRRVRDARGRTGTHHITYELDLPDGRTLRTRVSHPPDRTSYGARLWGHILGIQLDVDEATFWACVRDGVPPARGAVPEPRENAIPADIASLLLQRVGLTEAEVAALTRKEAVERLNQFWLEGR
jgi:hypothetical protein